MLPASSAPNSSSDEPEIRVTRKELAELSGTTVETAIRVTKAMERDGLLDLTDHGIVKVSKVEALTELAEGL